MELLEALRDAPYPIPVIVVTGTPSLATAVASLRKDAVDYLTKPVDYRARPGPVPGEGLPGVTAPALTFLVFRATQQRVVL